MNARLLRRGHLSADTAVRQGALCACERRVPATMGYSADMAPENDDPADFDRLARRYLDLWQSQLAGLASDQALTEQIARLFAPANTQVASPIEMAQGARHAASPASDQTGTPAAAASPGNGAD